MFLFLKLRQGRICRRNNSIKVIRNGRLYDSCILLFMGLFCQLLSRLFFLHSSGLVATQRKPFENSGSYEWFTYIIPGEIRTHNLWLRRPTLCPIELRGQNCYNSIYYKCLPTSSTTLYFRNFCQPAIKEIRPMAQACFRNCSSTPQNSQTDNLSREGRVRPRDDIERKRQGCFCSEILRVSGH